MSIKSKVLGLVVLASAVAFAGPVSHFGRLVACGANLCGEKTGTSTPIQLKGPSLYWSTGKPAALFNPITVEWFVMNYNISVIRAPMAIKFYKENSSPISKSDGNPEPVSEYGYLSTDNSGQGLYKSQQKGVIKAIVDQAIKDDIYVIVDWHSHNASSETAAAATFFKEMATEYNGVPNIIWEIYNEPVSDNASTINNYAMTVVKAIRDAGNDNLVIIGTNWYSSKPKEQESQGLHNKQGYSNLGYTLHFYTGEDGHSSYLNNKTSSTPTFVTEWGATGASGDGSVRNFSSYLSWMDQNKVSGCMWFAGNDNQTSAMFPSDATPQTLDNYKSRFSGTSTTAGVFNSFMSTNKWTSFVPSSHPMGNTIEVDLSEGESLTLSSQLGLRGSITGVKASYGEASFTASSITYQSPEYGSPEKVYLTYKVKSGDVEIQELVVVKLKNRKPILKDTTISVSHKATTKFTLLKLRASDPTNGSTNSLRIEGVTASKGTASVSADTIIYEPAGEGQATVTYRVSNANGTSQATLTLNCENQAPTIYDGATMTIANTEVGAISLHRLRGKDADGDSIWIKAFTKGQFPGSLKLNGTADTLYYTPEVNKIGTVTVLAVLTDGTLDSKVGSVKIKVTGSGSSFDGTIPVPTSIDGYEPPVGIVASGSRIAGTADFSIKNGQVMLTVPQNSRVSLEIFDTRGHKVASVFHGTLPAGSHAVNMNGQLPKGVYIARLRYGSQVKSTRFINR